MTDYELCGIRLMYSDKMKETGTDYYRYWLLLLKDTQRFIDAGLKSLEYQATCPEYRSKEEETFVSKEAETFPAYAWKGKRADLTELLAAIYCTGVIRLKNGKYPPFATFAQFIGRFFGIEYKYPADDMRKILQRKRNKTRFLLHITKCLQEKRAE
jgi:hypothetical protein